MEKMGAAISPDLGNGMTHTPSVSATSDLTDDQKRERSNAWAELVSARGSRYEDCRLVNFVTSNETQSKVVETLKRYADDMPCRVGTLGQGIVLYGPTGTGKDHLAFAMARAAVIRYGIEVAWVYGMDLFGERRDGISANESEGAFVRRYARPRVLLISDPLPPVGELSNDQRIMLARILDRRYSNGRPTWCTINVAGRKELDARLGVQLAERIIDGAVTLHCNWESFRASATDEFR